MGMVTDYLWKLLAQTNLAWMGMLFYMILVHIRASHKLPFKCYGYNGEKRRDANSLKKALFLTSCFGKFVNITLPNKTLLGLCLVSADAYLKVSSMRGRVRTS
jgi:hypothetical protein